MSGRAREASAPLDVRVVMMQRDEGVMLEKWLRHYVRLFGWSNLTIFDNGSTDDRTLAILKVATNEGADVRMGFGGLTDFRLKHEHFGNVIRSWDAELDYDFALPVDCNEMLAVFSGNCLTIDRDAVLAEFRRLRGIQQALRIDMSLFNVSGRRGWYCANHHFVKSFLPARTLGSLDFGLHDARSGVADGFTTTRLTYLHHHNRPLPEARRLALRKLSGRVDTTDPEALAAYAESGLASSHLVPMLTLTQEAYLQRYDNDLLVYVASVPNNPNLLEHGGRVWTWQPENYLQNNPDVAQLYSLGALHHYLRHGFAEGRAL